MPSKSIRPDPKRTISRACSGRGSRSRRRQDWTVLSAAPSAWASFASPISAMKSGSERPMGLKNYTNRVVHARCSNTIRRFQEPKQVRIVGFMSENQKDSYTVSVGERLAAARRAAATKITQAKAAELFTELTGDELTSQAIANYEQGTRLPSPPTVAALCKIYGTSTTAEILGLDDGPQSMRELALLKKYRLADDRGKYALDRLADAESASLTEGRQRGNSAA